MKKSTLIFAGIAVFAGVFAALQADHYLAERSSHAPVKYLDSKTVGINVDLPAAVGSMTELSRLSRAPDPGSSSQPRESSLRTTTSSTRPAG
jgi:hypothetical protein